MASHKLYAMPFYFFFIAYSVETVSSFRFSAPTDEFIGKIHAQLLLKLPGGGIAHKNLPIGHISLSQFAVYIISFQCLGYAHTAKLGEDKEHADGAFRPIKPASAPSTKAPKMTPASSCAVISSSSARS